MTPVNLTLEEQASFLVFEARAEERARIVDKLRREIVMDVRASQSPLGAIVDLIAELESEAL